MELVRLEGLKVDGANVFHSASLLPVIATILAAAATA
jgi:hypothetical protein